MSDAFYLYFIDDFKDGLGVNDRWFEKRLSDGDAQSADVAVNIESGRSKKHFPGKRISVAVKPG